MERMLRRRKKKLIRTFFRYLNRNESACRGKLKRVGKIWWDEVIRMYAPKGEGRKRVYGGGQGLYL